MFLTDTLLKKIADGKITSIDSPLKMLSYYYSDEGRGQCSRDRKASAQKFLILVKALQSANCKLTKLILHWHDSISDSGAAGLSKVLQSSHCKITKLSIYSNDISQVGIDMIAKSMSSTNCKLVSFALSGSKNITNYNEIGLALASPNCHIAKLQINRGSNRCSILPIFKALLFSSCSLTFLDISNSLISHIEVDALSKALKHANCSLRTINLSSASLKEEGLYNLGGLGGYNLKQTARNELIRSKNYKVTDLIDFSDHKTYPSKIKLISQALQNKNCKITELDLNRNKIGSYGLLLLAQAMQSPHSKLKRLNISYNSSSPEAARAIAKTLQSVHCKLISLSFDLAVGVPSAISSDSAVYFSEMVAIMAALKHPNCRLTHLTLANSIRSYDSITKGADERKVATALIEAILSRNCKLVYLDFSRNYPVFNSHGCSMIIEKGLCNAPFSNLTTIKLKDKDVYGEFGNLAIPRSCMKAITSFFEWNKKIKAFYFGKCLYNAASLKCLSIDTIMIIVKYLDKYNNDQVNNNNFNFMLRGLKNKPTPKKTLLFSNINNKETENIKKNKKRKTRSTENKNNPTK